MRYTTRNIESGQASINCDVQTALNRLAYLEDWWELYQKGNLTNITICQYCKHTEDDGCGEIYCKIWDKWEMPKNGYCYRGERK